MGECYLPAVLSSSAQLSAIKEVVGQWGFSWQAVHIFVCVWVLAGFSFCPAQLSTALCGCVVKSLLASMASSGVLGRLMYALWQASAGFYCLISFQVAFGSCPAQLSTASHS